MCQLNKIEIKHWLIKSYNKRVTYYSLTLRNKKKISFNSSLIVFIINLFLFRYFGNLRFLKNIKLGELINN